MASQAIRSQTCTQILQPMHSSNRICTFGMTTLMPSDVSRGVCSMQSTGQKLTHASQPVQLSGMTTASSLGFFFFRVILAGASGMIRVGFAFFGSYATYDCASTVSVRTRLYRENRRYVRLFRRSTQVLDCNTWDEYVNFGGLKH